VYTKHLGELMAMLGDSGVQNLDAILKVIVRHFRDV
jgi:hypothetical protein